MSTIEILERQRQEASNWIERNAAEVALKNAEAQRKRDREERAVKCLLLVSALAFGVSVAAIVAIATGNL
jgi:hypothetical protein